MQKNKENYAVQSKGDRFIPNKIDTNAFQVECNRTNWQSHCSNYQQLLGKSIFTPLHNNINNRIMDFTNQQSKIQKIKLNRYNIENNICSYQKLEKKLRKVNKKPYKILDAPNLQDDFYLNLLDWSSKNQIAVALDSSLYIWSGCSSQAIKLYQNNQISDYICSVKFCTDNKIAIGNSMGQIKIFDLCKRKKTNHFEGHNGRVGSLDCNGNLLASGSRDGTVASWDLRDNIIKKYKAHTQEICGLKWSPQGNNIASGGNDNKLVVHCNKTNTQLVKFHQHKAAVKAIGWCPSNPSILTSGGGTADRHIRFFSIQSLIETHSIDTGSQICNLIYSNISNEMITTHGYSLNQINLWNSNNNWQPQSINKVSTLTGHTYRVLYLATSPSGQSIVTGAGDQTLRFWNVFDGLHYQRHQNLTFQMDLR